MWNGLEKSIWNQYLFNNPMVREKTMRFTPSFLHGNQFLSEGIKKEEKMLK